MKTYTLILILSLIHATMHEMQGRRIPTPLLGENITALKQECLHRRNIVKANPSRQGIQVSDITLTAVTVFCSSRYALMAIAIVIWVAMWPNSRKATTHKRKIHGNENQGSRCGHGQIHAS